MPSLTINGHSVTIDDSFDKMSPEDQNAAVDHIAQQLHDSAKPSGVVAGLGHGISEAASGIASTLGLGGVKSDTLNSVAEHAAPKDYKAAPLIREGGHWYNPSDYQPGNLPQIAVEMAPGLSADILAGKTGAMVGSKIGGARGALVGGIGSGIGSALLRTFGPGAHENAAARTGDENAPVTGRDMGREAIKQLLMAVPNAAGVSRFLPGVGGSALKKYLTTAGTEASSGGARDVVSQLGTSLGQEHGKEYDPNRTAEATAGGLVLGGTLAAPKLAGDTASNFHFRNSERTPEAKAGSEALATRILEAAGGKPLVSALGNTEAGANAYHATHAAVHRELAAASKGEVLSQDNANTLANINGGLKVSDAALETLSKEASPETMHLAHQAMESARLKGMGNVTDKKFTGGISGSMESLAPISNPVKTLGAAGLVAAGAGHAAGLGLLGTYGLPVIGSILGAYGGARVLDKMTGLRAPVKGFTDRYGGTDTPVRAPAPQATPAEPATTSVPQVAPPQNTALWGNPVAPEPKAPTLRAELNSNVKIEEGMAKIAKRLGDEKRKSMISDALPALSALARTRQTPVTTDEPAPAPVAPAPTEAPNLSPVALSMLKQKLKQGLPPVSPVPDAGPPASPAISALMQKLQGQGIESSAPAPGEPQPPLIAKINKKTNGKIEETPHENSYAPMDAEQLWGRGMGDKEFATTEASKMSDLKYPERYMEGVIRDRQKRRGILADIVGEDTGPDSSHAAALLEELHHTRRADKAEGAIGHFTAKMSPGMKAAIRKRMDKSFINSMWKR